MKSSVLAALMDPLPRTTGGELEALRIPQITLHVFCDTPEMMATMEDVVADRRMSRTHAKVVPGGVAAAIELYRQTTSPNLVMVETRAASIDLHGQLDALADVCVTGTKLIVCGYANDIALYRELMSRGVSEYIVAPTDAISVIRVIARLYSSDGAQKKLGRRLAFIGARGGAGSSTLAQNVASILGRTSGRDVILADLDLPFGSVNLGFNLDAASGIAQALQDTDRLDYALLERLLTKCGEHLSVLAAPTDLERTYDLDEATFEQMLDIAQSNVPFLVLDLPHVWTAWARRTLLAADEIVITATPDLVSLRNAKNLIEQLKRARPNDASPKVALNQVGMPKRSEIKPGDFAAALQLELAACIPFDSSTLSAAATKGRMVADISRRSPTSTSFAKVAESVAGRAPAATRRHSRVAFSRLWKS